MEIVRLNKEKFKQNGFLDAIEKLSEMAEDGRINDWNYYETVLIEDEEEETAININIKPMKYYVSLEDENNEMVENVIVRVVYVQNVQNEIEAEWEAESVEIFFNY